MWSLRYERLNEYIKWKHVSFQQSLTRKVAADDMWNMVRWDIHCGGSLSDAEITMLHEPNEEVNTNGKREATDSYAEMLFN